jgi:hypothetical protein
MGPFPVVPNDVLLTQIGRVGPIGPSVISSIISSVKSGNIDLSILPEKVFLFTKKSDVHFDTEVFLAYNPACMEQKPQLDGMQCLGELHALIGTEHLSG